MLMMFIMAPWKELKLNKKSFKRFYNEAISKKERDPAAYAASKAYRLKAKGRKK